eukprot:5518588-Lingulodinium_polyedra.AAC.1
MAKEKPAGLAGQPWSTPRVATNTCTWPSSVKKTARDGRTSHSAKAARRWGGSSPLPPPGWPHGKRS